LIALGIILHENAQTIKPEDHPMWPQEFIWFVAIFYQEFRQGNGIAFEVLMMLAFAHFFGFYNPKQLADFLGIPHQKFYTELKHWSVYQLKKMLLLTIPNWQIFPTILKLLKKCDENAPS
jgi:hypothetical protein